MKLALNKVVAERITLQRFILTLIGSVLLVLTSVFILYGSIRNRDSEIFVVGLFHAGIIIPSAIALITKSISVKGFEALMKGRETRRK